RGRPLAISRRGEAFWATEGVGARRPGGSPWRGCSNPGTNYPTQCLARSVVTAAPQEEAAKDPHEGLLDGVRNGVCEGFKGKAYAQEKLTPGRAPGAGLPRPLRGQPLPGPGVRRQGAAVSSHGVRAPLDRDLKGGRPFLGFLQDHREVTPAAVRGS